MDLSSESLVSDYQRRQEDQEERAAGRAPRSNVFQLLADKEPAKVKRVARCIRTDGPATSRWGAILPDAATEWRDRWRVQEQDLYEKLTRMALIQEHARRFEQIESWKAFRRLEEELLMAESAEEAHPRPRKKAQTTRYNCANGG